MTQHAAVLFANDAFYAAFAARDANAMDAVWARRAPVACIHPGWQPLDGREAVMESWRGILGNPQLREIKCRGARATVWGEAAMVVCHETLGGNWLVATNLFVLEDGAWRLVHHQAAPAPGPPAGPALEQKPSVQ
jgi:ketosteroid isomerase-like protein